MHEKIYSNRPENKQNKPDIASEGLIDLPDKRILVIGTNHGESEPFPGQSQTEQEMRNAFGNAGPDALALDGQEILETKENVTIIKNIATPDWPGDNVDFWTWGIQQAIGQKRVLILADPVNSVHFLNVIAADEIDFVSSDNPYPKMVDQVFADPEYQRLNDKLKMIAVERGIADFAADTIIGLGILYGISKNIKMTRRAFLQLAGADIGTFLISSLIEQQLGKLSDFYQQAKEKMLQDSQHTEEDDYNSGFALFNQPRQLTAQDYESPSFKRQATLINESLQYAVIFRNAMIAEVLSLPTNVLKKEWDVFKPNIAVIMGFGHLTVLEKHSISYLIKNKTERQGLLQDLISGLITSIEEGIYGDNININQLKDDLRNFGRTYTIDENGTVNVSRFTIPIVNRILDQST